MAGCTKAWKNITTNDYIDNAIRRAYLSGEYGALKRLEKQIDRPYNWIRYRARVLGVRSMSRWRSEKWTRLEDELLEKSAHLSTSTIWRRFKRAGYQRTANAIEWRIRQLALDRSDPNILSSTEFAQIMGVCRDTVARWVRQGLLKSKKIDRRICTRRTVRDDSGYIYIAVGDAKAFIRDFPQHIDLRKVDKYSFLDLTIGPPRVMMREMNVEQKEAA